MIRYEPGTWGVWFGLTCYGSVFPKSFCVAFPCSLCCGVLHLLISKGVIPLSRFERDSEAVGSSVLGGFTFILGFLIVFRSQQAYSRWWEGGTLLQQIRGEWFNAFSSLVAFCNPAEERKATVHEFQHHLVRLVSLLYGSALEQVTTMERAIFEMIDLDGFPVEHLQFITGAHDRVEIVLQWLQKLIVDSEADGTIKIAPPILSRVYNQLGNGIVNLNNARKITEFPIPFPLAQMVAFGLVCHWWMTLYIAAAWPSMRPKRMKEVKDNINSTSIRLNQLEQIAGRARSVLSTAPNSYRDITFDTVNDIISSFRSLKRDDTETIA